MDRFSVPKQIVSAIANAPAICSKPSIAPASARFALFASLMAVSVWSSPSLADDPFRSSNPRNIGDSTEAAFKAIFEKGNYLEAKRYLQQAETQEPNEPLAYAMKASLTYSSIDWKGESAESKQQKQALLDEFKLYADKTLQTAEQLTASDSLRGNLYTAVGHFLQGAHTIAIANRDAIKSGPQALSKLQQVFEYLDKAEKVAPDDAELNLLKGYMDLMIAVNLPFSNPNQAIERLEKASPSYLAYRGIAVGYRDLKKYDKAWEFAEKASQITPNNPELFYLKGQILVEQGKKKNNNQDLIKRAVENFDKAIAKEAQLPANVVKQLKRERDKAQRRITGG
ncbi:hypothetical protein NDA06_21055 [Trichocoleus sp. ST-U1]|nr:Sll0314/Alr1548 family TPR repeat-containing protein [Coleofasciculus sp. FACHB-SPT36]